MKMDPHAQLIHHPSGQTSCCIVDDFTDPWKKKQTVMLQGGFGRHSAFFYHWVPALARHYRVIRRDLLGHGYSSAPSIKLEPQAYSLESILDDIVDTMNQLGCDKVHFLGESTSGILGEIMAARMPERLHSLTICSSPTHLPASTQDFLAMGQDSWPSACRALGSRGWAQALAKLPGTMASPYPEYKVWWLEQVALNDSEGLASYADFLSTLDSRPYLSQINVPVLILCPTRSAATTVMEQQEISRQIKGSNLVQINGAGHEIYVDSASECQQAFLDFLSRLEVTPR